MDEKYLKGVKNVTDKCRIIIFVREIKPSRVRMKVRKITCVVAFDSTWTRMQITVAWARKG